MSLPPTVYAPNTPAWDDGTSPRLPQLTTDVRADVAVIGLGGTGLSAIAELLSLGRSVVGIDSGSVAGGAAGRNGGILRAGTSLSYHDSIAAFGHDRARTLYALPAAEIDRIERDTPEAVRRTGSLRVAANDDEWAECMRQLDALRSDGVDAREQETQLGRGVFVPRNASLQPVVRARALAERAVGNGAQLFERTPALSFDGTAVVTPLGRIGCGAVVVAVDGGLEELVPALVGEVRTTRLQMLATEPDPDVRIPCPISANAGFDYWQQLPDGRIALGGGRQLAPDREWGAPAVPSDEIQKYLDAVLRDRIGSRVNVTHRWAARVGYTPSGLPVLTEVTPNVWATGGYNGTGNLMGALCGRAAAQLAAGEPSAETREFTALLAQPLGIPAGATRGSLVGAPVA